MDPVTATTAAGGAKIAGTVVSEVAKTGLPSRLFGPLVDEIGGSWAEGYRRRNVERLAEKAARRAPLEGPSVVNARVAYRVLQDGSFCNDDVMQEYLAGLVAGSYTEGGSDDRASYYVDLVARLPAAQVHLHHAIYAALATAGPSEHYGEGIFLNIRTVYTDLLSAAEVLPHLEGVDSMDTVSEALSGLHREGLVGDYAVASRERYASVPVLNTGVVMMAEPTGLGIMLALWAHGIRDADVNRIIETADCNFDPPGPIFNEWAFKGGQGEIKNLAQPLIS